ncbi:MAG: FKBP-type peptidyl-prolyl cis-trans isomerase [Actinomycetales bacterium]|nr:FKBP-type peptidyl-prolyl cis-trans isomerase [Actinomycetales bacterium]
MYKKLLALLLILGLALTGCSSKTKNVLDAVTVTGNLGSAPVITIGSNAPASGTKLEIKDLAKGSGEAVKATSTVTAHYTGVGLTSKQQFDSSWDRGQPIDFPLSGVIKGWQEGLVGMQVGGRRVLSIPGELAYGPTGNGVIGPNETLIFVVDLVGVK